MGGTPRLVKKERLVKSNDMVYRACGWNTQVGEKGEASGEK